MKIGELSAATGCPIETIRYYEKEGLLPGTARSEGNYRIYHTSHRDRLTFIRRCRSLDMSLEEIRQLLLLQEASGENCAGIDHVIAQHLSHVSERIRELQGLKRQLAELLAQCSAPGKTDDCGVLKGLAGGSDEEKRAGHVPRSHR